MRPAQRSYYCCGTGSMTADGVTVSSVVEVAGQQVVTRVMTTGCGQQTGCGAGAGQHTGCGAGAGQQTGCGAGQQTGCGAGQQTGCGAGQQTGCGAGQQAGCGAGQQLLKLLYPQHLCRCLASALELKPASAMKSNIRPKKIGYLVLPFIIHLRRYDGCTGGNENVALE